MKTKIIAELCYNHQGNIELAKKMILKCKELGLWGVKLQKWDIDSFPPEVKNRPRVDSHAFGKTYYQHRKALEFTIDQIITLKQFSERHGLVFVCSGKDIKSIKQLVDNNIKNIKLPSQRYFDNVIFNYLVNKKIEKNLFILVSTGMNRELECLQSKWIQFADVIFHCVSLYPVPKENADLGHMRKHKFYNGYSCHEKTGAGIKYAVAMGAEYIERHFTLDKTAKGTDNALSSDPAEMERIIAEIMEAEIMTGERRLTHKEEENRQYYRRF